jgi:hypothetical protein
VLIIVLQPNERCINLLTVLLTYSLTNVTSDGINASDGLSSSTKINLHSINNSINYLLSRLQSIVQNEVSLTPLNGSKVPKLLSVDARIQVRYYIAHDHT